MTLLQQTILFWVQIGSLLALAIYVIKTWEMASATRKSAAEMQASVEEMRKSRELEMAPYIVVFIDVNIKKRIFYLVIRNTGKTAANNLKITINPPLYSSFTAQGHNINEYKFLTEGFKTFPPHYEFRIEYDHTIPQVGVESKDLVYEASVEYSDELTTSRHTANFLLEPWVFKGLRRSESMDSVKKNTKAIQNEFMNLNKTMRSIDEVINNRHTKTRVIRKQNKYRF